jgi:hypothetical protein
MIAFVENSRPFGSADERRALGRPVKRVPDDGEHDSGRARYVEGGAPVRDADEPADKDRSEGRAEIDARIENGDRKTALGPRSPFPDDTASRRKAGGLSGAEDKA